MMRLNHFYKNTKGSVLPIVGIAMMAIIGSTGVAVDMGRVQIVQARLQNSIDAAGLAAGSVISTTDPAAQVNKYFGANYPTNYMGSTIDPLVVTPSADNTTINISATGSVPTTFMRLFGISSVPISANSQITRAQRGLELVLAIDNTGSMSQTAGGSLTKIQAAKNASHSLLDILYGSNNTNDNLWVGLVPFSQAVNIGTEHVNWTETNSFFWGSQTWFGCVDAREASNRDTTDDPPNVSLFPQYYWPCDGNNGWYGRNYDGPGGSTDYTNCSTSSGWQYRASLSPATAGPNLYCPQPLTELVAEKSTLDTAIDNMQARGNTHVGLGAAWAWRLLSPRWRGLWGGEMDSNGLPLDYNAPLMSKAMVLMTDGDNTIDNGSRGAYWYLNNGKLGTTNSSTAKTRLDTRTTTVCTNMKNNGIIIYTIALGTSFNTASRNMLRSCASKPEFYFESPTTSQLNTIFKQIGDSLANLRVSQ